MNVLVNYEAALDKKSVEYRRAAVQAEERGDERERSLNLMRASMLGDMLKALGRAEHNGRRGILQKLARESETRAESANARGDYDAADRERIKAETILWALECLETSEEHHE